jgi:hypothetical protein
VSEKGTIWGQTLEILFCRFEEEKNAINLKFSILNNSMA